MINFTVLATTIGEVIGIFGTLAGIAEVYLYKPHIPIDTGDEVKPESIEEGSIKVESIEFTYPTK